MGSVVHYDRQPVGIGYFDEPVFKHQHVSGVAGRRSDDRFPHLHMVMVVDGMPSLAQPAETTAAVFERAYEAGALQAIWRRWNPNGAVHVEPVYDIAGALDYASKTAKRDPVLDENQIVLLFGGARLDS